MQLQCEQEQKLTNQSIFGQEMMDYSKGLEPSKNP